MKYTFTFLQDYLSARGVNLIRVKKGQYEIRRGDTVWKFTSLEETTRHIRSFY